MLSVRNIVPNKMMEITAQKRDQRLGWGVYTATETRENDSVAVLYWCVRGGLFKKAQESTRSRKVV